MAYLDYTSSKDKINGADLGNMLIKCHDKWRGFLYLKEDITLTVDRSLAARFYLLKSGDTTILNGDRVTINSGNKVIIIDESNKIYLHDRTFEDKYINNIKSFIITNGTDNTDPITYETPIYLISNKDKKTALKYEWGINLITPTDTFEANNDKYINIVESQTTKPEGPFCKSPEGFATNSNSLYLDRCPKSCSEEFIHNNFNTAGNISLEYPMFQPSMGIFLVNGHYGSSSPAQINTFKFSLEKADNPITNLDSSHQPIMTPYKKLTKTSTELFDDYRGVIMIILLMIVLILCIIITKDGH